QPPTHHPHFRSPPSHLAIDRSAPPVDPPSFPTRRSSDLEIVAYSGTRRRQQTRQIPVDYEGKFWPDYRPGDVYGAYYPDDYFRQDRKSTRLNSSHVSISYAVFCLKKKK